MNNDELSIRMRKRIYNKYKDMLEDRFSFAFENIEHSVFDKYLTCAVRIKLGYQTLYDIKTQPEISKFLKEYENLINFLLTMPEGKEISNLNYNPYRKVE